MPAIRTTIYIPEEIQTILGAESGSARINGIISRYAKIVAEAQPALTASEWLAVLEVCNGLALLDDAGTDITGYLWAEVADCAGLGQRWGIDQDALAQTVRALPYVSRVAIAESARAFWAASVDLPTDQAMAAAGIRPIADGPTNPQ